MQASAVPLALAMDCDGFDFDQAVKDQTEFLDAEASEAAHHAGYFDLTPSEGMPNCIPQPVAQAVAAVAPAPVVDAPGCRTESVAHSGPHVHVGSRRVHFSHSLRLLAQHVGVRFAPDSPRDGMPGCSVARVCLTLRHGSMYCLAFLVVCGFSLGNQTWLTIHKVELWWWLAVLAGSFRPLKFPIDFWQVRCCHCNILVS